MADKELTVLLMLEAVDKASSIFDKVSAKIKSIGDASKDAAGKANLSGEALANAQVKAEAAANAAAAAERAQAEAQSKLSETSQAARTAAAEQEAADSKLAAAAEAVEKATGDAAEVAKAAYAEMSTAAESAATASKTAVAQQVAALDELKKADAEVTTRTAESKAAQDALGDSSEKSGSKLKALIGIAALTAAAVTGIAVASVKSAASFQSATTVLVTSGGETAQNIGMVRQGILQLAGDTGTATQQLTNGMYMIGSAGYTGASGLNVLKASAQGAKAEGADLGVVSNALTTELKDYGVTAKDVAGNQKLANTAMNQMIAIVQNGKTTTEALASSLSTVLPRASAVKIGFDQVGGAMATMTGEGMTAQNAAQDLASTISSLQKPNAVATKEMAALGINSVDLSNNLGKNGLTGTFEILSNAVTSHMGKDGLVVQNAFAASKQAAADANAEIAKMPTSLQKLAKSYLEGSVTATQWKSDLNGLDPISKNLMTQFAGTADKTHEFNSLLAGGSPAAETYSAAMSKLTGTSQGLQTALALTGANMGTFKANVAAVGEAGKKTGSDVNGWAEIQATMNQKLAQLKETANAAVIELGTALLPAVTKLLSLVMDIVGPIATWIGHNKTLAAAILGVAGALSVGLLAIVGVAKVVSSVSGAFDTLSGAWDKVGTVASKVGKGMGTAKDFVSGLGGSLKAAAGSAKEFGANALEAAQSLGSSAWSAASGVLSSIGEGIATAASATADYIVSTGQATVAVARQGIALAAEKVTLIATAVAEKAAAVAQFLLDAAMDANPITLIVIAIMALIGVFLLLWSHCKPFRDFWIGLWHDAQAAFEGAWQVIDSLFHDAIGIIKGWYPVILGILTGGILLIPALVFKYWSKISAFISECWDEAVAIVKHWYPLILGILTGGILLVPALIYKYWSKITGFISSAWGDAMTFMHSIPGKILGVFSGAATWLLNAGESIISGLVSGITSKIDTVKNALGSITKYLPHWKGPPETDKVLLKGNGQLIMQGLITGIDSQTDALRQKLGTITTSIQADVTGGTRTIAASASGLAPASPVGAGTGGPVTNLYVTGNTVMTDADIDKLIAKMGTRLTRQTLPSAGVRMPRR